jgi:hypothetical protein
VSRAELIDQARDFAAKTQALLNGTVTTGIPIGAILDPVRGLCYVGYGITKADPVPIQTVPLTIGRAPANCFLELAHYLRMDDEGVYLTDLRASFGLYAEPDLNGLIVRYDYVRLDGPHPAAHVHVGGSCEPLEALCERRGVTRPATDRRHFPVGGKRFRPSLEDLIEFVAHEGLLDVHEGWEQVVAERRADFHQIQLRAAVRRDQATAAAQLEAEGWSCTPPT